MLLSNKYDFLTNYFTKALTTGGHALPQSIILYGNDFDSQYKLACEIARLLNCAGDKSDGCECLNCKWIRESSHPAVITVSKSDFKPEDDDSKTVISVKQSSMIKEQLIIDSEFHRVFILCDRDENGNIAGLNQLNFQADTANSMLKIIEEPLVSVTFIFLTRYIDDLLSTIVSRSQCFFVPSFKEINYDYSVIEGIFENYWTFKRKNAFDISQKLQNLTKDKPVEDILLGIQNYMFITLRSNPKNTFLIEHLKFTETALKEARLGIKPANIFDDLCLKLFIS